MRQLVACSVGLFLLVPSVALAATRTVGQTIVYDFNEAIQSTPTIPAGMSQQNIQRMEAAQNKPQAFVLTLTLEEISPDGSAHAKATLLNTAAANAPASLRDASSNFMATLAPDGEIIAQYDPNMQPKTGAAGRFVDLTDVNLNNVGGQVVTHLSYFNTFAKGCAHPHVASHPAWEETLMDSLVGQRTFNFFAASNGTITDERRFQEPIHGADHQRERNLQPVLRPCHRLSRRGQQRDDERLALFDHS